MFFWFGQHRSSNSYLYQQLREARGLNYGDYAYIEYFPRGMFQFTPDPNQGRNSQIFQIWIRPVVPENGHFVVSSIDCLLGGSGDPMVRAIFASEPRRRNLCAAFDQVKLTLVIATIG